MPKLIINAFNFILKDNKLYQSYIYKFNYVYMLIAILNKALKFYYSYDQCFLLNLLYKYF